MNVLKDTTALALTMCLQYADETAVAVDATCGRGHDTVWLARRFAKVYAFDVQEEAVEATRQLLEKEGLENVTLVHDSHEKMGRYISEPVQVVVFNLGYLPGGDKTLTTEAESTLEALNEALEMLSVDGLLCVTMYQGHSQGYLERKKVLQWAKKLDTSIYHCVHTDMINQPSLPPEILWVTRKR